MDHRCCGEAAGAGLYPEGAAVLSYSRRIQISSRWWSGDHCREPRPPPPPTQSSTLAVARPTNSLSVTEIDWLARWELRVYGVLRWDRFGVEERKESNLLNDRPWSSEQLMDGWRVWREGLNMGLIACLPAENCSAPLAGVVRRFEDHPTWTRLALSCRCEGLTGSSGFVLCNTVFWMIRWRALQASLNDKSRLEDDARRDCSEASNPSVCGQNPILPSAAEQTPLAHARAVHIPSREKNVFPRYPCVALFLLLLLLPWNSNMHSILDSQSLLPSHPSSNSHWFIDISHFILANPICGDRHGNDNGPQVLWLCSCRVSFQASVHSKQIPH